eukprot:136647_1
MNVFLPFIGATACFIFIMVIIMIHLFHQFRCSQQAINIELSNANFKTQKTKLQKIITFLCIISCIICSCSDLWKIIWCFITNKPTYYYEIFSAVSDSWFYISSILLYIRLIYFQLHVPFKSSAYIYSTTSLCMASIPIFILVPCMILYIYGLITYIDDTGKEDDFIAPLIIIIMTMDSLLNIITLYLLTKQLKQLILDTPYDKLNNTKESSVQNSMGDKSQNTNTDATTSLTFAGTQFQYIYIALIARYTTLTVVAIIGNQLYYIVMCLWIFVWKYNNIMGLTVFVARGMSNVITVIVQYLLWYRYTKNVYHICCGLFDGMCFRCCTRRIKRKYKKIMRTKRHSATSVLKLIK